VKLEISSRPVRSCCNRQLTNRRLFVCVCVDGRNKIPYFADYKIPPQVKYCLKFSFCLTVRNMFKGRSEQFTVKPFS